jgi:hypothetical protein
MGLSMPKLKPIPKGNTINTKPIRKTIYFDPMVLDALRLLQLPQESLSLAISRLLSKVIDSESKGGNAK